MRILSEWLLAQSDLTVHPEVQPDIKLTARERELAALVGLGLSNCEIARELVIAPSTAERHVANILQKLGMRSRSQIAAWRVHQLSIAPEPSMAEWFEPS
jgi:DNA-binding NarL/FixJ family response regulator